MARAGWQSLVTELDAPMAVRRSVAFAQAIYDREVLVEDVAACKVDDSGQADAAWLAGKVAVIADPAGKSISWCQPDVVVDARMIKQYLDAAVVADKPLVIGLGPGFSAPKNCHAVVETQRGPYLGRVIWEGSAEKDTGVPELVNGFQVERVLRAPVSGVISTFVEIGQSLQQGDLIAEIDGTFIHAGFTGVLRGLLQTGLIVQKGTKIGDLDPRNDPRLCQFVSDKALAVGGGVIEAILSHPITSQKLYA
jgi:xanthine dehydrogenase accessory factor